MGTGSTSWRRRSRTSAGSSPPMRGARQRNRGRRLARNAAPPQLQGAPNRLWNPGMSNQQERLVNDLVASAQQLLFDGASVGDLKLAAGALQEMRAAFKMFAPYHKVRKVSTFGSARTREGDPVFKLAETFARQMAERSYMVITGAGPGVMEACQRGAGRAMSFGINIRLPFEQESNRIIRGDPK